MSISRSVALVGRPNVGKSRLFNRLAGKRISIVHDQPGVTRDLVTIQVPAERGGYLLMDTGGIGLIPGSTTAALIKATEEQVDFALAAAGIVLFVVDAHAGLTSGDERIAEHLRTSRKKVILVANKADDSKRESDAMAEFTGLGFGEVIAVSAEHGRGLEDLHSAILSILGPVPQEEKADPLSERVKFALIGRPNVGKSSLGNALLKDKRLIVSEVPGTTRDAVAIELDYTTANGEKWPFTLLDTAGLRPRTSVKTPVEFFSQNRSHEAIAESDVVFLVLDALEGVTRQDKVLAGEVIDQGRGLVIVVNKWDLAEKRFAKQPLEGYATLAEFKKDFIRAVERQLFFTPQSPILFTSALEGTAVTEILEKARALFTLMRKPLPTSPLNRVLRDFIEVNPPKFAGTSRFKCYYSVQVARQPFTIRLYCNRAEKLDEGYARHLAAGVQTAFKLHGCPIKFDLVGKPRPERRLFHKDNTLGFRAKQAATGHKHAYPGKKPGHGKGRLPRLGD